ncbi:MAG: hypothetical protein D6701_04815, partial [Gemmatimonadetes bacterium]
VFVRNQNQSEIRLVLLRRGGDRETLGVLGPRQADVYAVSWPREEVLTLDLELLGGFRYRVPPLRVSPGDQVDVIVAPDVRRTTLFRR